jgi:hypothetical protein
MHNKLNKLKASLNYDNSLQIVKNSLDDTFLVGFDPKGKEVIAKEIINHIFPTLSLGVNKVITRKEVMGGYPSSAFTWQLDYCLHCLSCFCRQRF